VRTFFAARRVQEHEVRTGVGVPALDRVGVRFEDGKQFLRVGNLLAFSTAAAGLVEDAFSQR
jgi:hypothetical protein